MGEVAVMQEDAARAMVLLEASLRLGREHDSPIRSAWTLNHLGHAAQLRGEYRRAALGVRSAPAAHATHARAMATARAQLGADAFAAAVAEGRARPLEQVIAEALSE